MDRLSTYINEMTGVSAYLPPALAPALASYSMADSSFPRCGEITVREYQIIQGLLHGKSTKEIAADLKLTPSTINNYVDGLKKRFGLENRTQLGMWIVRRFATRNGENGGGVPIAVLPDLPQA